MLLATLLLFLIPEAKLLQPPSDQPEKLVASCVLDALRLKASPNALITTLLEPIAQSPSVEIQNFIIKGLNLAQEWNVEVSNGYRNAFQSWRECLANCSSNDPVYKNHFKHTIFTSHYVIITDNLTTLTTMLLKIRKNRTYNMEAIYYICYLTTRTDDQKVALEVLETMYRLKHYRTVAIVPAGDQKYNSYAYDLFSEATQFCGTSPEIIQRNVCINGSFQAKTFLSRLKLTNLNCTVNAFLMQTPPFIINRSAGVEIRILEHISDRLNISYNFTINSLSQDWGAKRTGNWTGLLKNILDDPFSIGVGCASLSEARMVDFDFSDDYFVEKMVWVVPAAEMMPQWKAIFKIFRYKLWIALLAIVVIGGVLIGWLSKGIANELNLYKNIGASLMLSLQVMIGHPAKNNPRTRVIRILFIHMALFNIIVGCLYQSGLINVLTNPKYEKQIERDDEIYESSFGIGGMEAYKEIFNVTTEVDAMKIYNKYEVYPDNNDSMYTWLVTVATDRDTITVLGDNYVKYHLAQNDRVLMNHDLTPKVYVVNEILFTYQVRLIFAKGFPLKSAFNDVINGLVSCGLVTKWRDDYIAFKRNAVQEEEDEIENVGNSKVIVLDNVQGMFGILLVGYSLAVLIFTIEIGIERFNPRNEYRKYLQRRHFQKKVLRAKGNLRRWQEIQSKKM